MNELNLGKPNSKLYMGSNLEPKDCTCYTCASCLTCIIFAPGSFGFLAIGLGSALTSVRNGQ